MSNVKRRLQEKIGEIRSYQLNIEELEDIDIQGIEDCVEVCKKFGVNSENLQAYQSRLNGLSILQGAFFHSLQAKAYIRGEKELLEKKNKPKKGEAVLLKAAPSYLNDVTKEVIDSLQELSYDQGDSDDMGLSYLGPYRLKNGDSV